MAFEKGCRKHRASGDMAGRRAGACCTGWYHWLSASSSHHSILLLSIDCPHRVMWHAWERFMQKMLMKKNATQHCRQPLRSFLGM